MKKIIMAPQAAWRQANAARAFQAQRAGNMARRGWQAAGGGRRHPGASAASRQEQRQAQRRHLGAGRMARAVARCGINGGKAENERAAGGHQTETSLSNGGAAAKTDGISKRIKSMVTAATSSVHGIARIKSGLAGEMKN